MEIQQDSENELVLGWGKWWKMSFKFLSILLVGATSAMIFTFGKPAVTALIVSPVVVFAVWCWKFYDNVIEIRFDAKKHVARIRHVKNWFLGGWSFLYVEEEIPLENFSRIYSGENYRIDLGTHAAQSSLSFNLRVPMEQGRSLRVYYGRDPETARYLKARLQEHALG